MKKENVSPSPPLWRFRMNTRFGTPLEVNPPAPQVNSMSYLVFLHHALYLVVNFACIMGHSEVWHLAEPVPADVGITAKLLLQTNPQTCSIRSSVETTLLYNKQNNTHLLETHTVCLKYINMCKKVTVNLSNRFKNKRENYLYENRLHTSLRRENTLTGLLSIRSKQLWLSWYLTKDHSKPSDTYSS